LEGRVRSSVCDPGDYYFGGKQIKTEVRSARLRSKGRIQRAVAETREKAGSRASLKGGEWDRVEEKIWGGRETRTKKNWGLRKE